MLEITMLPARQGDALWIRWGDEATPHQMIVDMGTEEIGRRIHKDIEALPAGGRKLDLLVVSHVDRDHIGGVLTCLAEGDPITGFEVDDVWFNGFVHLNGRRVEQDKPRVEAFGPAQGKRLSDWLRKQAWNKHFGGGPVQRVPGEALKKVVLHDNLTLTVLGPTPRRLADFITPWKKEVEEALDNEGTPMAVSSGLESYGPKEPPDLEDESDLKSLADTDNPPDKAHANGTSISLLMEYKSHWDHFVRAMRSRMEDLVDGIKGVSPGRRLRLDAFKLPHHGSRNNVMRSLVESVDCDRWLFSTDGTIFRHPDPIALARVIVYGQIKNPLLSFNVPSTFNGWWDNADWKNMFGYRTEYGTKENGLTLRFDGDS